MFKRLDKKNYCSIEAALLVYALENDNEADGVLARTAIAMHGSEEAKKKLIAWRNNHNRLPVQEQETQPPLQPRRVFGLRQDSSTKGPGCVAEEPFVAEDFSGAPVRLTESEPLVITPNGVGEELTALTSN